MEIYVFARNRRRQQPHNFLRITEPILVDGQDSKTVYTAVEDIFDDLCDSRVMVCRILYKEIQIK